MKHISNIFPDLGEFSPLLKKGGHIGSRTHSRPPVLNV